MSTRLTLCNSILTGPKPIDVSVGYRTLPNRPEPLNLGIGSRGFLDHCVGQSSGTATGGFTGGTGGGGPTTPTTPTAGPSNVGTNIVKPALGPSGLTDDLVKPVAGPSSISTDIVKPAVGPDQINSTINTPAAGPSALVSPEFTDADIGRQIVFSDLTWLENNWDLTIGRVYTTISINNAGSRIGINDNVGSFVWLDDSTRAFGRQRGVHWDFATTPAAGPSALLSDIAKPAAGPSSLGSSIIATTPAQGPSGLTGETLFENEYSTYMTPGTSNSIQVGSTSAVQGVQNFSQAFWFKTSKNSDVILQVADADSDANWIKIFNGGGVQFRLGGQSYVQGLDEDGLNDGEWHFLVQTYDAGYLSVYVDGVQVGVSNNFLIPTTSPANWTREMYFVSNDGYYDEWGVWDVTLDAANVLALYNNGSPVDLEKSSGNYTQSQNLVRWESLEKTTYYDPAAGENGAPVLSNDLPTFTNRHNIYLGGSAYSTAGVLTELQGSSAMSLSFWFRSSNPGEGPSTGCRTGFSNQWGFIRAGGINYVQVVTQSNGGYFSYSSPSDTNYHHYALTYSAGTNYRNIKLYIDGSVVPHAWQGTGSSIPTTLHSENVSFEIGRNGSFYSIGDMDEVSLFDKALSQSEITSIYNSGTPNDISSISPLAWWRMGDSNSRESNTVIDISGNGNNATLVNAVYSDTTP